MWVAILISALGCYAFKLAGLSVPESVLGRRVVQRIADLLPVALLAALVGTQTFAAGTALVVDARLAGLLAGVIALLLRAPFIVVVAVAAATTALLRLIAG
ncbi:MAG: AzlD domain-containing protein [Propionibacteriales bacterium]|nr:AzlD domain-containing protein [Propionibacteriales bacterium]